MNILIFPVIQTLNMKSLPRVRFQNMYHRIVTGMSKISARSPWDITQSLVLIFFCKAIDTLGLI